MVETAWQALCAQLGELPPACKALQHEELQFLLDSLQAADISREKSMEAAIEHTLRFTPGLFRPALRKMIFS